MFNVVCLSSFGTSRGRFWAPKPTLRPSTMMVLHVEYEHVHQNDVLNPKLVLGALWGISRNSVGSSWPCLGGFLGPLHRSSSCYICLFWASLLLLTASQRLFFLSWSLLVPILSSQADPPTLKHINAPERKAAFVESKFAVSRCS